MQAYNQAINDLDKELDHLKNAFEVWNVSFFFITVIIVVISFVVLMILIITIDTCEFIVPWCYSLFFFFFFPYHIRLRIYNLGVKFWGLSLKLTASLVLYRVLKLCLGINYSNLVF